jgi:hypothetical protein
MMNLLCSRRRFHMKRMLNFGTVKFQYSLCTGKFQ